jgi:hypothetical protein
MSKALIIVGLLGLGIYIWYKKRGAAQPQVPGAADQATVPPDSNIKLTPAHVLEDTGLPTLHTLPIEGTGSGGFSGWRSGYASYPDTGNNVVGSGVTKIALNPNLESLAGYQYGGSQLRLAGRFQY